MVNRERGLIAGALVLVNLTVGTTLAWAQYPPGPQITKDGTAVLLQDYASLPLSSRTTGVYPPPIDMAGQLGRVNFLRSEPANAPQSSSRFFVNDLNRTLYLLDTTTKTFTPYINFEDVFPKFHNDYPGYGSGLITFAFDPDYAQNGKFYTSHTEDPNRSGSAVPTNTSLPGLDLSGGYTTTTAVDPPAGTVVLQGVIVEWTDTNQTNSTFEGTAREILRVGFSTTIHPLGEFLFHPSAQPGHDDYGNLYILVPDGGAGEIPDARRTIPQRLDALQGKIVRITPSIDLRPADELSSNGRYRIPTTGSDPNPFISEELKQRLPGLKKEIYAYGFRDQHRMSWDPDSNKRIVNDIGLLAWEEVNILTMGGNYGYSEREGIEQLYIDGTNWGKTGSQTSPPTPFPNPDELTVTGIDTPVTPVYPVAAYSHEDGDAISSGFVYRGSLMPELYGKYVFGDITTARLFFADLADMIAKDDGDRTSLAAVHELQVRFDSPHDNPDQGPVNRRLFDIVADEYVRKGGNAPGNAVLPGSANATSGNDPDGIPYGGGRADIRLALGGDGEIYVLSKSDGMIRQLVAVVGPVLPTVTVAATDPTATEAGVTTGTFAVSRTGSTAAALTVNYTVSGTATPGTDYTALTGSVTIPAAAASSTITATPINDTAVEANEAIVVSLSPDGAYVVGAPGTGTVTIISDDTPPGLGVYDSTLKAPKCGAVGSVCDSGPSLLNGRDGKGPEPNQPNTINSSCADGIQGSYHDDESLDRLKVSTLDDSSFAPGKTVRLEATVWAWTTPLLDKLELYYAANANNPSWQLIATLTPPVGGAQTLSATYALPSGTLQAVRARFRYQGTAGACGTGDYNDHDDLIFAVGAPPPDSQPPTTAITAPQNEASVSATFTITASANDNVGVSRVEFYIDGVLRSTDTTAPHAYAWNTTAFVNGSHSIFSRAYDAANNVGTSATVNVDVSNQTAIFDSVLKVPKCGVVAGLCDSGPVLLNGRDGKGPEANQPNTINGSCTDGTLGSYHNDESNDRIRVFTNNGSPFAAGTTVTVQATVWAWTTPSTDKLQLYYAANANNPSWQSIATLTPPVAGAQTLSATYTLPSGTLQAVRARFRYQGTAAPCGTGGGYDDHDDLVFTVR